MFTLSEFAWQDVYVRSLYLGIHAGLARSKRVLYSYSHALAHPRTASARRNSTNRLPLRSSTNQAPGDNSEVLIYPQAVYKDPFRPGDGHILVMCDCYTPAGEPLPSNTRFRCNEVMEKCMAKGEEPWFGIEQEYVAPSFPFLPHVFSVHHLHVSHCCVRDNHQYTNREQLGHRTSQSVSQFIQNRQIFTILWRFFKC
jgi:glutamine synthetase